MNRRNFLQKVSDLAKGSVAAITLSKIQIAAVAASLATVSCEKENPFKTVNENAAVGEFIECCPGVETSCENPVNCGVTCLPCTTFCSPMSTITTGALSGL